MPETIKFEELERDERELLLRAFDYDVDENGYVLSQAGTRIKSEETPGEHVHVDDAALIPGSLDVIEATPTALSRQIRLHG